MAYDCFVATCYSKIMKHRMCAILAIGTSFFGCIQAIFLTTLTFQLSYCGPNVVEYYFCDIPAMLKLACADISALEMVGLITVSSDPFCKFNLLSGNLETSPLAVPISLPSSLPLCQWSSYTSSLLPTPGLMQLF
ncbi:hypothetical protein A6R68_05889, partial [Neotoma lepida]